MHVLRAILPAVLILLLLAAPTASAQPKALITVKIKWSSEHDEMTLGDNGRGDMGTTVEVFGEDFVCAQPLKFKVELDIKDIPKVFGSSMVPKLVPTGNNYFVFDQGRVGYKPASAGDKPLNSPNQEGNLNMAWDLDGVPTKDANFDYVLRGTVKSEGSGSCYPTPEFRVIESPPMKVRVPDRAEPTNEQDCLDNPALAECATTAPIIDDGGQAAGPSVLILLLGLVGAVGVWRRNQR